MTQIAHDVKTPHARARSATHALPLLAFNLACSRKQSLVALHSLLWHNDNDRVCPLIEFHARDHAHRGAVDVIVNADFFMSKVCEACTCRRAPLLGNLALERVVCKVAIFVPIGGCEVITKALRRSTDARDIPNGALLFWRIVSSGCFGIRGRTCSRDDRHEG
ncbi:MAG: hypothetical protein QOI13_678 [Paraburkholderia sp.]|nr:hypothetical protein [Paraburkholderia sp.]